MTTASYIQRITSNDSSLTHWVGRNLNNQELVQFSTGLKKNTFLKFCQLHDCDLKNITALADALKVNRSLENLELLLINIGNAGGEALAGTLIVNTTLTELSLHRCDLGNIRGLTHMLKVNRSLRVLHLAQNDFGDVGGKALATALKVNTTLLHLSLSDCLQQDITALAEALKVNRTLQKLDLSQNDFVAAGWQALTGALKVNATLRELILDSCHLKDITALANTLKVNRSLQILRLGENCFGDVGGKALAGALWVNTTLTHLDLFDCMLEDITPLTGVLKVNRSLQILYLGKNPFGSKSITELADALKVNRFLKILSLSHSNLIDAEGKALAGALKDNTTLTELGLGYCDLKDIAPLAEALKVNRSLRKLNLTGNKFRDAGGKALVAALKVNITLTELDLGFCDGAYGEIDVINERLAANKALTEQKKQKDEKENSDENTVVVQSGPNKKMSKTMVGTPTNIQFSAEFNSDAGTIEKPKVLSGRHNAFVQPIQLKQGKKDDTSAGKKTQPNPSKKNVSKAMEATSTMVHCSAVGINIDVETMEKLRALPGKHEALAQHVEKITIIDTATLDVLKGRSVQLLHLFEYEVETGQSKREKAQINASPVLQTYHHFFARLLTGTWMACQSINSGMIDNDEMDNSDYVGQGLDKIGKQIPGISIITTIFSSSISAWNYRDKKKAVQRLALLFPDLDTAFSEFGKLTRQITLAQEIELKSLPAPTGTIDKMKEKIKDAKTYVLAEDADTPIKRKAVEDCKKLLTAIKEGKLPLNPSIEDFFRIILGSKYFYHAVDPVMASPSNNSRKVAKMPVVQSPSMTEMSEELRKMKEREIEREAELERMKKKVAKLEEQQLEDDTTEFGNDEAQLKLSKSKQVSRATNSAANSSALAYNVEVRHRVNVVETNVSVHAARLEEHNDEIATLKAELKALKSKVKK